eukprot:1075251-Alexandrium_andersonii.AAC.1
MSRQCRQLANVAGGACSGLVWRWTVDATAPSPQYVVQIVWLWVVGVVVFGFSSIDGGVVCQAFHMSMLGLSGQCADVFVGV